MIELTDTNAAAIAAEFVRARRQAGSPAMGMVMTLVVVVDEDEAEDARWTRPRRRRTSTRRGCSGVILGDGRGAAQVDAQVGIGAGWTGETALIRLSRRGGQAPGVGRAAAAAARLPRRGLVADATRPTTRRPTRSGGSPSAGSPTPPTVTRGKTKAHARPSAAAYAPGNTDLAWTRLTPWRALLAAALDQHQLKVTVGVGRRRADQPERRPAGRLAGRPAARCRVERRNSRGPGHHRGRARDHGRARSAITRPDGRLATSPRPATRTGRSRSSAARCRELLAEELRRLDEDDVYAAVGPAAREERRAR